MIATFTDFFFITLYLKSHLDEWVEVGNSLKVIKRLKSHFDPNGIFNPGRFVGEI